MSVNIKQNNALLQVAGNASDLSKWVGTKAEWDAIDHASIADGTEVIITDDEFPNKICNTVAECEASENANDVAGASAVSELSKFEEIPLNTFLISNTGIHATSSACKIGNMIWIRGIYTTDAIIPSGVWTTIGKINPAYKPGYLVNIPGVTGTVDHVSYFSITADGDIKVYQSSGAAKQCVIGGVSYYIGK